MAKKQPAGKKPATARNPTPAKRTARTRRPAPKVAVDGDLNPDYCYYDPAKGTVVLGLDVFDGTGWETVLVKFGVLMADEVGWLEGVVADARAAVGGRDGRRPPADRHGPPASTSA
jgi:hypothetical protein